MLPPAFINPCYGQFIINWWLWRNFTALFTICRPVMVNLSSLGCSNAIIQQRVSLSTLIMLTYHTPVYTLTERMQEFFYNQHTHPCAGLSRNDLTEALAQCDATRRNPASSNELHTKLEDVCIFSVSLVFCSVWYQQFIGAVLPPSR